jgi:hypothetical protein
MHITSADICVMIVLFVLQVGTIITLAACDLDGMKAEWAEGYVSASNFMKIAAYASTLPFLVLSSIAIPLACASAIH